MISTPNVPVVENTPVSAAARAVQQVGSKELLGSRGELLIEHQGRVYRLRVTQNDKLILTA